MTIPPYYKNDQFLPGNHKEYGENIKLNSLNYRTTEFDQVDWGNSVVIFGCSNTYGAYLPDEQTISCQLETLLRRPVINMGVPASSIAFSVFNQVTLAEKCANPYAVINLWTGINRLPYFSAKSPYHIGVWNTQLDNNNVGLRSFRSFRSLFQSWNLTDSNPCLHSLFLQRTAKLIWKDTVHIEKTFFSDTSKVLDVDLLRYVDNAADGQHPGPESTKIAALKLAEQLK